jgi:benzylsuccinate CoA-transferase BbsF subunit
MSQLPLEGYRVADFSWVIAGPYCTQWLAVMGAEVIRIESGQHTDINRRIGPFADDINGVNRSGLWNGLNLSKKSCTLNLTDPRAVEIAKEIVKISDVVVENFGYGMMERFGLAYPLLRELKPDLVLVSSSGLGKTGPYKAFTAYNEQFVGYGGLASLTGYPDGSPQMIGGVWADHLTGTYLAIAVLAALHHRSQTGEGQYIDMSMTEAVMSQIPEGIMDYTMNQRVRGCVGNRDDVMAPHNVYPCKGEDKWVAIAISTDEEWEALCQVMGNSGWSNEERFSNASNRWENQEELDRLIGDWTRTHTSFEVMEMLQHAGVAAGPSLNMEEMANNPHLQERGFYVAPDHPEVGQRTLAGLPWKLSDSSARVEPPPVLGEDNEYVFCELLGMSDEEFATLVGEGVIT